MVAIGGFHEPNFLGVPGEDMDKVMHYYQEPWPFFDQDVLVVGMQFGVARVLGRLGALDGVREATRFSTRIEAIDAAFQSLNDADMR